MSHRVQLEANSRSVFGKKVRQLRRDGQIPAVIYGQTTEEPVHIQVEWPKLRIALSDAGGSNLVDVDVAGEIYTTLIREVARHPVRRDVLHVDFYAVDLTHTIVSHVPVFMHGDPETAQRIAGRILLETQSLEVESFPDNIPSEIVVDVSGIEAIGDTILLEDLPEIEGVKFLHEPDMVIVRSDYLAAAPVEDVEREAAEGLLKEEGAEPKVIGRAREDEEDED
ncbi:MAG: 50S ribosomal protein L25 [Chloroflexi bacterium]|nr:50S ribosomal protein L25 [Chloroflexota bacterium]